MNINDIISSGLLELYALGLSSPEETSQVQDWINQYPEVKQELNEIESSLESYAQAHAVEPSASVKENILSKISSGEEENNLSFYKNDKVVNDVLPYRIPSYLKIAAAAAIVLLIGSIILNYSYYHKYQSVNNELQVAQQKINEAQQVSATTKNNFQSVNDSLEVAQQKLKHQETLNRAMDKDIDVMTDKYALPVVLNGTPHAPDALAKIFWLKNTGEVYVDPSNLPAVPSGKQYQLWAIIGGKPVSGGLISTEKGIYRIQKMKSFGKADAFAITLEKAGGSPTPTMSEMYVIAKI